MTYTTLDGLPIPRRAPGDAVSREIVGLAARLTCTSDDMLPFWDELAAQGWVPARSSTGNPGLTKEGDRQAARARLDALIAVHLYELGTADMEIILADFKALANREQRTFKEYRTRRLVLAEMETELSYGGVQGSSTPIWRTSAATPSRPRRCDAAPTLARRRRAARCARENLWTSPAAGNPTPGSWMRRIGGPPGRSRSSDSASVIGRAAKGSC